jgi:hypothetical protein
VTYVFQSLLALTADDTETLGQLVLILSARLAMLQTEHPLRDDQQQLLSAFESILTVVRSHTVPRADSLDLPRGTVVESMNSLYGTLTTCKAVTDPANYHMLSAKLDDIRVSVPTFNLQSPTLLSDIRALVQTTRREVRRVTAALDLLASEQCSPLDPNAPGHCFLATHARLAQQRMVAAAARTRDDGSGLTRHLQSLAFVLDDNRNSIPLLDPTLRDTGRLQLLDAVTGVAVDSELHDFNRQGDQEAEQRRTEAVLVLFRRLYDDKKKTTLLVPVSVSGIDDPIACTVASVLLYKLEGSKHTAAAGLASRLLQVLDQPFCTSQRMACLALRASRGKGVGLISNTIAMRLEATIRDLYSLQDHAEQLRAAFCDCIQGVTLEIEEHAVNTNKPSTHIVDELLGNLLIQPMLSRLEDDDDAIQEVEQELCRLRAQRSAAPVPKRAAVTVGTVDIRRLFAPISALANASFVMPVRTVAATYVVKPFSPDDV